MSMVAALVSLGVLFHHHPFFAIGRAVANKPSSVIE
jgi:hypothetical protein